MKNGLIVICVGGKYLCRGEHTKYAVITKKLKGYYKYIGKILLKNGSKCEISWTKGGNFLTPNINSPLDIIGEYTEEYE